MSFVVPLQYRLEKLTADLTPAHTMRIYGNNFTPVAGMIAANFTEIAGGGYANKPITFANWTIDPVTCIATYTGQTWIFTGVIDAPGTIYGYYMTRDSDSHILLAERFPVANVPFSPVTGSKIVVLPTFSIQSQF